MSDSTSIETQAKPQPIVPPPDFPVTWQNPGDERYHWSRDRMHDPDQQPPMVTSLLDRVWASFNAFYIEAGLPTRLDQRVINTYGYMANVGASLPTEAMEAVVEGYQAKMLEIGSRLQETWEQKWLPDLQAHLAFWEEYDLAGAPLSDLIRHLDETVEHTRQIWELHFHITEPVYAAISYFDDFYQELFGNENPFGAYALLEGIDNLTVEMGQALWRLSRQASLDPDVRATIENTDLTLVMEQLNQSGPGRDFLAELDAFLEKYGRRSELWWWNYPSWIEDPTPVIQNVRTHLAQPNGDPQQERLVIAARREERIAEVRSQLQGYPQPVLDKFNSMLTAAQVGIMLSEDHGFWLDFPSAHYIRQVLLEFGRRLSDAGVIRARNDVFYLSLDELRATAVALPQIDRKDLIAARQAEFARFATVEPPQELGTPPPETDSASENALDRTDMRFMGASPSVEASPELITGNPGSPGIARGVVKVVQKLADATKLKSGDVLVAVTTAPPWTPIFAIAAAVVTDTGGILSHCAVVAREYGIPAVVGTGSGSTLLHDGQMVEVDGKAGTVRIIG